MSLRHMSTRPSIRAAVAIAACAVLVPLWAAPAASSSTYSAPGVHTSSYDGHAKKPTIVLVHGAWADSSSWNAEITKLERDGYHVEAVPNELRGLSSDAAYVKDYLSTVTGPIVLVGHSYGGAVITNAATGNPNVKALVYIDAFIPDAGQKVGDLIGPNSALSPALTDPTSRFRLVPYPGAPAGVVDTYLLPKVVLKYFAPDVPVTVAKQIAVTQRPLSVAAFGEPSGPPAWKAIPSWALVGNQDQIIPKDRLTAMAKNAGAHIVNINSSHVSLISHPGAVTALIEKAAHAVG